MLKEKADIEILVHHYATCVNDQNAEALAALYAVDGVFRPNNYPSIVGKAGIEKSAATRFSNTYFRLQYEVRNVSFIGNVAIVDAIAQTITDESGHNLHSKKTRDQFVFKQSENGWHIVSYMFNDLLTSSPKSTLA